MLILLPPSEGKATGGRGQALDLDGLSFAELGDARQTVLDELIVVSGRADAADILDTPAGAAAQVHGNTRLRHAPTLPVRRLYTGVLYDALDVGSLSSTAKRRAGRDVVVQSALFGALRLGDRVPPYRLSMSVRLPGLGPLAAHWRGPLEPVMGSAAGRGAIVDLRSSTYAAAWRPTGDLADRAVSVAVVRDGPGGRTAVSHMAKHTRGLVARTLLEAGGSPRRPDEVAEVLAQHFAVRLAESAPGTMSRLEVVEP